MGNTATSYLKVNGDTVVEGFNKVDGIILVKVHKSNGSKEVYPIHTMKKIIRDDKVYYIPNNMPITDYSDYILENIVPVNKNEENIDRIPILCSCKYFTKDDVILKGFKDYLNAKAIMYITPDSYTIIRTAILRLNRQASTIAPSTVLKYIRMFTIARGIDNIDVTFK